MARSGPVVSLTVTNEPSGTISPAALRVLSRRMSSGLRAELRVRLRDHLIGAAEAVEVVDVERPQIHLHGVEDVLQSTPTASPSSRSTSASTCGTLTW